jgi:RHS repeat-associated protein
LTAISGGTTASFTYDALGRRISKTINGVTTGFLYDGNDIIAEMQGGTITAFYLRGLNIDEPFIRITAAGNEYYHTDALGSTLALTNDVGAVTTTYAYEPFGKTTITGISTNPFQYTGRENDGTGLYYYRARYYAPSLQRFLNEDPLFSPLFKTSNCSDSYSPNVSRYIESDPGLSPLLRLRIYTDAVVFALAPNPQQIQLYTYANDNSINKVDPFGLRANSQNPGCDAVGKLGGVFTSTCGVKCCNAHDSCYQSANGWCDAGSWLGIGNPECNACNQAVVKCLWNAATSSSAKKGQCPPLPIPPLPNGRTF